MNFGNEYTTMIHITHTARERLRTIDPARLLHHPRSYYMMQKIRASSDTIYSFIEGRRYPAIRQYVEMGRFLDWDLSHDINYLTHTKTYGRIEVKRRITRLIEDIRFTNDTDYISELEQMLCNAIERIDLSGQFMNYVAGMYLLSDLERQAKFPDAIILED